MKKIDVNKYGFYSVLNKPSQQELKDYYQEKYYQEAQGSYELEYSNDELAYFDNKISLKHEVLKSFGTYGHVPSLIDVGCGEGFTLSYFANAGWNVSGLDYSDFGCKRFNPHIVDHLVPGDIYENITSLINEEKKFDVIWIKHVLEHVIDPFELLVSCLSLAKPDTIMVVEVPNDFSKLQQHLLSTGKVDSEYWVKLPDHLSYFNSAGLTEICKEAGWELLKLITDYPIDINLFLQEANYIANPAVGRSIHKSRIEIENFIHTMPANLIINYYEAMQSLGLGREIIGFFRASIKEK